MKIYSTKILFIVLIICLGQHCTTFAKYSTSRYLDSLALIQLYDATNGDQWTDNSDWKSTSLDTWKGIVLTSDGQNVREIVLSSNGLTGNLPNISLPKLEVLQLQTNQISGNIPDLSLPMLENLQLFDNAFVGTLPSLSGCPNLEILLLYTNQLEGNIPDFSLANLEHLSLYCNNLTGHIPDFANCPNLTILDIAKNQLSSVADLSNLPLLCSLDLFENQLTFDGLEVNASTFPLTSCTFTYHLQDSIPIIQTGDVLSVNAGGTLSNNTFEWYHNGSPMQTIVGADALTITQSGTYYVKVANSIATQLDLYSKSINVFCNANTLTLETTMNNNVILPVLDTLWIVDTLNYPTFNALPSGMTNYVWSLDGNIIGGNQQSIGGTYTSTSGTYGVTVTDICGNTATTELHLYLDDDSVWPGDVDCNDVVNMDDLLEWGHIAIGTNGYSRNNVGTTWEGQACQDWSLTHPNSNKDVKHSDCDGNGVIELADVAPILDNFHAEHNGNNAKVSAKMQGAELIPRANTDNLVNTGDGQMDTVFFNLHLENNSNTNNSVDNVYGLRFSMAYRPFQNGNALEAVEAYFDDSWLGVEDVSLKGLYKNFISDSIMYVGVTRITQQDTTGHGILCEVGCILQVDLLNLRTENPNTTNGNTRTPFTASDYETFILKAEDLRLVDENGVSQAISGGQDTVWIVPNNYCKPKLNSSSDEWIEAISIGNFTQISGNNNGYQVFTDTILQFGSGETLPIHLTPRFASAPQGEVWQIWLDINEDDEFTSNEILFTSTARNTPIINNISIPNIVSNGQTRLRIAMKRDTAPNSACEQFTNGEVEDYFVNIAPLTTLKLNAFLEAAYDSVSNTMNTDLVNNGLLPQAQPFNVAPWHYDGTEILNTNQTDMVDWLLLELRTPADPYQTIAQQAVLLLEDGTIVNTNYQDIQFYNLSSNQNYHITLRARNHIAVMTATPLQVANNQIVYDFTSSNTQAMGGAKQLKLVNSTTSVYALCAGDFNSDGIVNVNDYQRLNDDMGNIAQYLPTDVNLDGVINIADFNIYTVNTSLIGAHCIRY